MGCLFCLYKHAGSPGSRVGNCVKNVIQNQMIKPKLIDLPCEMLFQIKSFLLVYEAVKTSVIGLVGVCGRGQLGVSFLRRSMCTEGMGWGGRWVGWVLQGTDTGSEHLGVS